MEYLTWFAAGGLVLFTAVCAEITLKRYVERIVEYKLKEMTGVNTKTLEMVARSTTN